MASVFERRGCNVHTLQQDLQKMRHITQTDALQRNISADDKESRIPLVLTYHPLNNRIKRILLENFKILTDDPVTKEIFPQPPMVAYWRDENLRDKLVHTSDSGQSTTLAGSAPCQHRWCRACANISSDINLQGLNDMIIIRQSFICQSSGLVYCISCRRCPAIYIGKTGCTLRERFGKHLRSIKRSITLCTIQKCVASSKQRKHQEMRLNFLLGSSQLRSLNSDFRYIWGLSTLCFKSWCRYKWWCSPTDTFPLMKGKAWNIWILC